jgi:poly-gamma-glutamate synthesis protein (capsule biosynthesis protein)
VGDVILGDQPACIGHGVRSVLEKSGFAPLFDGIRPQVADCDLLFGNLETVLSDQGCDENTLSSVELRGRPDYAPALAKLGFRALSVANNHAMQYGRAAFEESAQALEASGIFPLGRSDAAGRSNCFRFAGRGLNVAFLAYSFRPDNYARGALPYATDAQAALDQIRELKGEADALAVSLHWGEEYMPVPSPSQIRLAHEMVDAGASLILGHHPHVLQGVERYRHGVIAYSLGNFVADFWQDYARRTMLLKCTLNRKGVTRFECIPVWIDSAYRPVMPPDALAESIRGDLADYQARIEASLRKAADPAEYEKAAAGAYRKYRMESYRYFLGNLHRYRPTMTWQSLMRFAKRRLEPS